MLDNSQQSALEESLNAQIEAAGQWFNRDPHKALDLVEEALQRMDNKAFPGAYARALRRRAMCYSVMGNLEASAIDFQASLEQAQLLEDPLLQSQCLHGLGNVYFYRGEFALALEYIHRSVALHRRIGDEAGLMVGLNSLGTSFHELGDFAHAVTHYSESLQIARRLGDRTNEALALSNIGQAKLDCGEPQKALEYLTESVRLLNDAGSRIYEPSALDSLATVYQQLGRLEEALNCSERAVQICRDLGNPSLEVHALYALAKIQLARSEEDAAERSLLQALVLAQTLQARIRLVDICCALGRLYLGKSDFDMARNYLEEGLAQAQKSQQKQQLSEMHLALSELYTAMGNYRHAYESHRAYHELHRILQKESIQNRLEAQLTEMEVERAQQQAEIHRLRNVELVEASRRNTELLERLQQHAQQLAELATRDALTDLYNRRYLQDYLQHELEKPHRRCVVSLAIADLDNFKQVNDRFSHLTGDEVLKAIAGLLQNTIRRSDIAVRLGGEEFVIVLPDLLREEAQEVCERVRRAIAAYDWTRIHAELKMTASIGVADSTEDSPNIDAVGSPTDRLLALADERLYQAKKSGKNRVV